MIIAANYFKITLPTALTMISNPNPTPVATDLLTLHVQIYRILICIAARQNPATLTWQSKLLLNCLTLLKTSINFFYSIRKVTFLNKSLWCICCKKEGRLYFFACNPVLPLIDLQFFQLHLPSVIAFLNNCGTEKSFSSNESLLFSSLFLT